MLKNNIYRVLSFSLFLFPFIFTLEICARVDDWFNYNAPILAKYTSECLREYDAEGIRHNIPFVRFEKWRINNMGFRGEDIDLHAEKNKIKVVCMGASETFGLYETENNEWPAQLGRLLGDKYCVINASVVGQFLENWQKYLAKYIMNVAPDIIILHINPFKYSQGNISERNSNTEKKRVESAAQRTSLGINVISVIKSVKEDLRIIPKIKQVLKGVLPDRLVKHYQLMSMKKQVEEKQERVLGEMSPSDSLPEKNIALFKRDLEALITYLKSKNIQIMVTSYPMLLNKKNIDEYPEIFFDFRRFYIDLSLIGLIDAQSKFNDSCREVAQSYGLDFVDLDAVLPKTTCEFGDNVHYTDQGAEIIAKAVSNSIQQLNSKNLAGR